MDEALRNGRIRILDRCPAGWAYLSGAGCIRQVIYTIIEQDSDIDREAFLQTLHETRERFPVISRFLLQIDNEFYLASAENVQENVQYTKGRVIGGEENGFHSFDISMDKNRIVLSTDRALMDPIGLMEVTDFFCSRYACRTGKRMDIASEVPGPALDLDLFSLPQEEGIGPVSAPDESAYVPAFQTEDLSRLSELILPTPEVLSMCKSLSASPSVLFALLLAEAVEQTRETEEGHLILSVPADCREVLKGGKRMRIGAFPVLIDLSEKEWAGLSLQAKAAKLCAMIRERRDPAFARGWIQFYKDYTIPINLFRSTRRKETGGSDAVSFMLSYLKPSERQGYEGKQLICSGISVPNDFTMLEVNGHFHLWLRPFCHPVLPAFKDLCIRNGLPVTERETKGASFVSKPPRIESGELRPSVFVFVIPAYGHLSPLLPLVRELVNRGFNVRVYTGSEMRERVEKTGAVCISFDVYYEMAESLARQAYGFPRMLELAENMDETIEADVRTFKPQFAVVDILSVWGRLLAEKHGLKVVLSSAARLMTRDNHPNDFGDYFAQLRQSEKEIGERLLHLSGKGFKRHSALSLITPGRDTDCIVYIPEELQGTSQPINKDRVFYAGYSEDPMPTRAGEKGKRPLIYVTLGTVSSRSPWFFRSAIAAFRTMEVDVVMAVWKYIEFGTLGKIPDNVRVVREVNQAEILQKADLAVFHAGLNTIRDCLLCGVPMAVFPMVADQFGDARMVKETGVGIALEDYQPDTIRKAAQTILREPAYREKAKALGERMRAMGGAAGAAAWICERMKAGTV